MEALFSYLIDDITEENTNMGQKELYKPILKLVTTPTSIATRWKRKKSTTNQPQARWRKRDLVWSTAAWVTHNVSSIVSGVGELVKSGTARPSWNYGTHLGLKWLRNTILFQNNTIGAVRRGEHTAGRILKTMVNCAIESMEIAYKKKCILDYERDGRGFTQTTQAWRYPIPQEDGLESETVVVDGEWIFPINTSLSKNKQKVILYFHGGCYILGSPQVFRNLTSLLARTNDCPVLALNYRLAPEHPFPAGLHDAFASYIWLLNPGHPMFSSKGTHTPYKPEEIIISGDSAGGGLAMALLNYLNMYLRNENGQRLVPFPLGAVLLSPWVDLTCSSKSWEDNKGLDFLPSEVTDLHQPVIQNVQHPVYSYCFGESGREIELLSPKGTSMGRIPSIVGISKVVQSEFAKKDQEWMETCLKDAERDALERFARHPLVSPIFGELNGLPPILIVTLINVASRRV
jgi:acetyl esterase/lipase